MIQIRDSQNLCELLGDKAIATLWYNTSRLITIDIVNPIYKFGLYDLTVFPDYDKFNVKHRGIYYGFNYSMTQRYYKYRANSMNLFLSDLYQFLKTHNIKWGKDHFYKSGVVDLNCWVFFKKEEDLTLFMMNFS